MAKSLPPEQSEQEEQKVQEILLILEQLAQREEATVRFILERLYDIGTLNLIHKKLNAHPLTRLIKPVGRVSRGTFRRVGTWWFQTYCPQLITNWLYSLVSFEPPKKKREPPVIIVESPNALPPAVITQEISRLRSQVRWLTTVMVGAIALLGSSVFWVEYSLKPAALDRLKPATDEDLSVRQRVLPND